jgi:flagellar FliL protein
MAGATGDKDGGKGGALGFVLALLLTTLLAGAAGGGAAWLLVDTVRSSIEAQEAAEARSSPAPLAYSADSAVLRLEPVVTNLAAPPGAWIRLEAWLVFAGEPPKEQDELAVRITEDILAFLRTVRLDQIEGPSGFLHLREDLSERAAIRSQGLVREVVIGGLVVE